MYAQIRQRGRMLVLQSSCSQSQRYIRSAAAVVSEGRNRGRMFRFGAAQSPLRTGRCRVRELRCSFTIATLFA